MAAVPYMRVADVCSASDRCPSARPRRRRSGSALLGAELPDVPQLSAVEASRRPARARSVPALLLRRRQLLLHPRRLAVLLRERHLRVRSRRRRLLRLLLLLLHLLLLLLLPHGRHLRRHGRHHRQLLLRSSAAPPRPFRPLSLWCRAPARFSTDGTSSSVSRFTVFASFLLTRFSTASTTACSSAVTFTGASCELESYAPSAFCMSAISFVVAASAPLADSPACASPATAVRSTCSRRASASSPAPAQSRCSSRSYHRFASFSM